MFNRKKKRNRKGDISQIIIALVFVIICLISVPLFKSMSNSNSTNAKNSNNTYNNFATDSDDFASGSASLDDPF